MHVTGVFMLPDRQNLDWQNRSLQLQLRQHVTTRRRGDAGGQVMNEVVVDRGANPYLTKIECWEHGTLITKAHTPSPAPRTTALRCEFSHPSAPNVVLADTPPWDSSERRCRPTE